MTALVGQVTRIKVKEGQNRASFRLQQKEQ